MAEKTIDNCLQFWPRLGFSEMLKAEEEAVFARQVLFI
jgi:hypothetical protein